MIFITQSIPIFKIWTWYQTNSQDSTLILMINANDIDWKSNTAL